MPNYCSLEKKYNNNIIFTFILLPFIFIFVESDLVKKGCNILNK